MRIVKKNAVDKGQIRYGEVRGDFMEQGPQQMNLKRLEQRHMTMGKG